MKCYQCGADLQDNVSFCRECGAKQTKQDIRFCRECGAGITSGAKFCSSCGAQLLQQSCIKNSATQSEPQRDSLNTTSERKTLPKQAVNKPKEKKKNPYFLTIIVAVLLVAFAFSWLLNNQKTEKGAVAAATPVPVIQESEHVITKGKQYAYMSDEWNVYIAVAISDSIVKIEHWDKTLSSSFSVGYKEDLGTYQINDPGTGFGWLDEEHTAFILVFNDKENSRVRKEAPRVFTLCVNDKNKNKGSAYDSKIRSYTYGCDDWHMYRAIPLTDNLIKMECWYRSLSMGDYGFGWTWCIIDVNTNDRGFQWTDDEHTSFTLTTHDPQNSYYWKTDTFVVFELENPKYAYDSVSDFAKGKKTKH